MWWSLGSYLRISSSMPQPNSWVSTLLCEFVLFFIQKQTSRELKCGTIEYSSGGSRGGAESAAAPPPPPFFRPIFVFLAYFGRFSGAESRNLDSRPPLFTDPGSATDTVMYQSLFIWKYTNTNHYSPITFSFLKVFKSLQKSKEDRCHNDQGRCHIKLGQWTWGGGMHCVQTMAAPWLHCLLKHGPAPDNYDVHQQLYTGNCISLTAFIPHWHRRCRQYWFHPHTWTVCPSSSSFLHYPEFSPSSWHLVPRLLGQAVSQ